MSERMSYFNEDPSKKEVENDEVADHIIPPEPISEKERKQRERDLEVDKKLEKLLKQPPIPKEARKSGKWKRITAAVGLATALHGAAADQYAGGVVEQAVMRKVRQITNKAKQIDLHTIHLGEKNLRNDVQNSVGSKDGFSNEELGIKGLGINRNADGTLEIKEGETSKVNWKHFFLAHEIDQGVINSDDARSIEDTMTQDIKPYKDIIKKSRLTAEEELRIIHEIAQKRGRYPDLPKEQQPYLSGIITKKVGDCKARNKRMISYLVDIFPDNKIKMQNTVENNVPHIRPIIEVGGTWYAVENTVIPLSDQDLEGTLIVEVTNYLKGKLGTIAQGQVLKQHDDPEQQLILTSNSASDGFDIIPPGVDPARMLRNHISVDTYSPQQLIEQPMTFEQAQALHHEIHNIQQSAVNNDFEIMYVSPEDIHEVDKKEEKKSQLKHFSAEELIKIKIEGKVEFGDHDRFDPTGAEYEQSEEYKKFDKLPHEQKIRIIEQNKLDLTPLVDISIKELKLYGVAADLNELHNLSQLREVGVYDARLDHLEQLRNAEKLQKIDWNGVYYPTDDASVTEDLEMGLMNKHELEEVRLGRFPIKEISFLGNTAVKRLALWNTSVTDLRPLANTPLKSLDFSRTNIRDISMFKDKIDKIGVKKFLNYGSSVVKMDENYHLELNKEYLQSKNDSELSLQEWEDKSFKPNFDYDSQRENSHNE